MDAYSFENANYRYGSCVTVELRLFIEVHYSFLWFSFQLMTIIVISFLQVFFCSTNINCCLYLVFWIFLKANTCRHSRKPGSMAPMLWKLEKFRTRDFPSQGRLPYLETWITALDMIVTVPSTCNCSPWNYDFMLPYRYGTWNTFVA